jgi:toxin HigB-1
MIVSYRNAKTERFAKGELEAATSLQDLAALPGNALEPLRGDRKGQYSIRINDQWRICFEWPKGANRPVNVEITDYH